MKYTFKLKSNPILGYGAGRVHSSLREAIRYIELIDPKKANDAKTKMSTRLASVPVKPLLASYNTLVKKYTKDEDYDHGLDNDTLYVLVSGKDELITGGIYIPSPHFTTFFSYDKLELVIFNTNINITDPLYLNDQVYHITKELFPDEYAKVVAKAKYLKIKDI